MTAGSGLQFASCATAGHTFAGAGRDPFGYADPATLKREHLIVAFYCQGRALQCGSSGETSCERRRIWSVR